MELVNLPKDVFGELTKLASIDLCSNLNGQICTALMMNPPPGATPTMLACQEEPCSACRADLLLPISLNSEGSGTCGCLLATGVEAQLAAGTARLLQSWILAGGVFRLLGAGSLSEPVAWCAGG